MDDSSKLQNVPPEVPVASKKRRRWPRVLIAVVCALLLLIVLAPYSIALGFVREAVEDSASENLNGRVHIGGLSWSWFDGVRAVDVRVDNPEGFPEERPALRCVSMVADVSLGSLFGGAPSATAEVVGLEVFVEQNADGSTNLQALAKDGGTSTGESGEQPQEPPDEPTDGLAYDVKLTNSAFYVRREGELIEELTAFDLHARSSSGSAEILVDAAGRLRAGDIAFDARYDPVSGGGSTRFVTHGLDLANWLPLVSAFAPGQLTALAGKLDGEVTASASAGQYVELGGNLTVSGPRLAGPSLKDMDLRSEQWTIRPALALGKGKDVDASDFSIDLEFLQVRGRPASADGKVTLGYELDLAALAEFGGPMPESLRGSGSKLTGELRVPTTDLPADAAGWAKAIGAEAALQIQKLELGGFTLRDMGIDAAMANGSLDVRTAPSTKLDGGALQLQAKVDIERFDTMPTTASVQWSGGKLTGGATEALRYAMPLFAGLGGGGGGGGGLAQIVGKVDLQLSLDGPASKPEEQSWLAWLSDWSGSGELALADTAFAPAPQLQGLLAPLGPLTGGNLPIAKQGKLAIDSFRAPFSFSGGKVAAQASEWLAGETRIGLSGSVGVDGALAYDIDLSNLLAGQRDGDKVLKALGGSLPPARLTGTLDGPKLGLPELGDVAGKLLRQEGRGLLEEGLQKGLEELFGGKKKKGGDTPGGGSGGGGGGGGGGL